MLNLLEKGLNFWGIYSRSKKIKVFGKSKKKLKSLDQAEILYNNSL